MITQRGIPFARRVIVSVFLSLVTLSLSLQAGVVEERPNIVIILADDQGYGDIKALHSACPISTPNMDRLCAEGAVFTEAYSPSAFCAPSRYSLLTGRYTWRTYVKIGFPQHNFGSGPVPDPLPPYPTTERMTVQRMLAKLGYRPPCTPALRGISYSPFLLSTDASGACEVRHELILPN